MMSRLLFSVAVVLALAGAVPGTAQADWDDRPDPSEFEESLTPNGYWVDDSQFGHVWRPYTWWGWRPYVDGHWIYTSYGWTWDSPEPWGWTFHYGRWGFSNLYGWVWTPGYVWGPAWVDWYWGDGFVGWVPLGPAGFAIVPSYWTYVRDFSFCAPRITNVVIVNERLPQHIYHHRDYGSGWRRSPDFRDIEHVSRHRIERVSERPDRSIAPWVKHRIERGDRVRERVASREGEHVIEHPGRGAADRRGRTDRDGGWRRPGRDDRSPTIEHGRGSSPDTREAPTVRGRDDGDDRMGHRTEDGVRFRQLDSSRGGSDRRLQTHDSPSPPPRPSDADHGFRPPTSGDVRREVVPHRPTMERPDSSMGYRSGGGGFEHGAPSRTDGRAVRGGAPTPRIEHGSGGGGGGRSPAPGWSAGGQRGGGGASATGSGSGSGSMEHGGGGFGNATR
jgi:hypothetical protein